jgi:hypothetical protein
MYTSVEEHLGIPTLEEYSLQRLTPEGLEMAECHLIVCADCRNRLAGIEPFNTVHYTQDGPFYSRITLLRNGLFSARHWGCQIDGGGPYLDISDARKYLLDSFVQMFPEHECGEACGDTKPNPNT